MGNESWQSQVALEASPKLLEPLMRKVERYARAGLVVGTVLAPTMDHEAYAAPPSAATETQEAAAEVRFEGMDLLPTEVAEQIRTVITRTGHYPTQTLRASVRSVTFNLANDQPLPPGMYTPAGVLEGDTGAELNFYLPPQGMDLAMTSEVVDYVFGHELGHLTDWDTHPLLAPDERESIKLAFSALLAALDTEKVQALREFAYAQGDAFTRGLPEHERVSGAELAHDELAFDEFWAACAGIYFDEPAQLTQLSPELFAFFDEYYKRFDPLFDAAQAKAVRAAFLAAHTSRSD